MKFYSALIKQYKLIIRYQIKIEFIDEVISNTEYHQEIHYIPYNCANLDEKIKSLTEAIFENTEKNISGKRLIQSIEPIEAELKTIYKYGIEEL